MLVLGGIKDPLSKGEIWVSVPGCLASYAFRGSPISSLELSFPTPNSQQVGLDALPGPFQL